MVIDRTDGRPCRWLVRLFHSRGELGVENNPSIWILSADRVAVDDDIQHVLRERRIAGLNMSVGPMSISDAGEEA